MVTFLRALGMVYLTTWLLEDRRLDEGSTTQTWAHIHLYTAPRLQYRSEIVISEPWPSARVVVPSRWIEHLFSGYKSEVIAIILRRHMARSTGREPDGLTTTLRLAGEPNTSLVYSAYLAHDRAFEAHRLSPTHRFQVGSCTLQVYRAFKISTLIFIELTFCPLNTWKSVGTEPLGN